MGHAGDVESLVPHGVLSSYRREFEVPYFCHIKRIFKSLLVFERKRNKPSIDKGMPLAEAVQNQDKLFDTVEFCNNVVPAGLASYNLVCLLSRTVAITNV